MSTSIVWFRKSLRLHDNPVLTEACEDSRIEKIIPLFILDPNIVGKDYEKLGASRLRFLIESLQDLDSQLSSKYGSRLILLQGDPLSLFEKIQQSLGQVFNSLLCEYSSEPYEREKFSAICQSLEGKNKDIRIKSFSASCPFVSSIVILSNTPKYAHTPTETAAIIANRFFIGIDTAV